MSDNTYLGTYRALVANNNDPEDGARVTLLIPQVLGTAESHWAIPSTPTKTIPQPGDLVWVTFDGGDINAPVYVSVGLLELDAKIDDVAANATVAGPVPKPPQNLALATQPSFTSAGIDSADVTVTWDAVAQNQDGTDLTNLAGYVVQYSLDDKTWVAAGTIMDTTTALHGLSLGVMVYVRVQTLNTDGQTSVWAEQSRLTASSTSKPPTPATPTATGVLGGIRIAWMGLDSTGHAMPTFFDYARLERAAGADTTFTSATVVATFRTPNTYYDSGVGYSSSYNYRLVAVSKTNVPSDPSDYANATAVTAGTADLGVNSVTANAILTGSLDAQYGKITSIDASVIKVNTYDLSTGSPIKTSANSARVELTAAGLKAYSSANSTIPTVAINSDGSASFTGTVNITAGSFDPSVSIPAKQLDATQIPKTTIIDGGSIMTDTITASAITVGDFTNLIPNAGLNAGLTGWSGATTATTTASVVLSAAGLNALRLDKVSTSEAHIYSEWVDVVPGDTISLSFTTEGTWTGGNGGIYAQRKTASTGALVNLNPGWVGAVGTPTNISTPGNKSVTFVVPADTTQLRFYPYISAASPVGGYAIISNMQARRMLGGSLLVDGAIDGKTITGATVRTSANSARVELTSAGLKAWDGVNTTVPTVAINSDGSASFTGTIKAGTSFDPAMKIPAKQLDATQIPKTTIIDGGSIMTDTITASAITVGDFTNLIPNAGLNAVAANGIPTGWTAASGATLSVVTAASGAKGIRLDKTVAAGTGGCDALPEWVDVIPGEQITISYTTEGAWTSGSSAYMNCYKTTASGSVVSFSPGNTGTSTPGEKQFTFTVPSDASQIRIYPTLQSSNAVGTYAVFSNMSARRTAATTLSARPRSFSDPMNDLTAWNWYNGSRSHWSVTTDPTAVLAGTVFRLAASQSIAEGLWRKTPVLFDPTALYKITVRLRKTTTADTTKEGLYLGVMGFTDDGSTLISSTGTVGSTGNAHYYVSNAPVPVGAGWTTYTGYVQGYAATGANGSGSTNPNAPGKMRAEVKYISPAILLNYNGGGAVWDIDSVIMESQGLATINGSLLVDGAIDGKTITGAIIKTGSSGDYWQISSPTVGNGKVNQIQAYTTVGSVPGAITAFSKTDANLGPNGDYSQLILQAPQIASTNGSSPSIELNSESRDGAFGSNIGYYANNNPTTMTGSSHNFDAYVNASYGVGVDYGDVTIGSLDKSNSRMLWHRAQASATNISGQYDSFEIRRYLYDGGATRGTATVLWNATDTKYEIARYQLSPTDGLQVKMTAAGGAMRGVVTNPGSVSKGIHWQSYPAVTTNASGVGTITHNAGFTPSTVVPVHRSSTAGTPVLIIRPVTGTYGATTFQFIARDNSGAAYVGSVGIDAFVGG